MNNMFNVEHWWEDGTHANIKDSQILRIKIVKNNETPESMISAFIKDSKLCINVTAHNEDYALFYRSFFGEAGILAYIQEKFITHYGEKIKGILVPK